MAYTFKIELNCNRKQMKKQGKKIHEKKTTDETTNFTAFVYAARSKDARFAKTDKYFLELLFSIKKIYCLILPKLRLKKSIFITWYTIYQFMFVSGISRCTNCCYRILAIWELKCAQYSFIFLSFSCDFLMSNSPFHISISHTIR